MRGQDGLEDRVGADENSAELAGESFVNSGSGSYFDVLPQDDDVAAEVLEFFQPEADDHLQIISDCLISLEGQNNPEENLPWLCPIHNRSFIQLTRD